MLPSSRSSLSCAHYRILTMTGPRPRGAHVGSTKLVQTTALRTLTYITSQPRAILLRRVCLKVPAQGRPTSSV